MAGIMKIPPFKLERFFARYEFKAPYLLSSSDCESFSIAELLAFEPEAIERLQQHWLGYTESQGDPYLRAEIARLYQNIQPNQVLVHAGAEEAIFSFMNVMLAPGDHVIVHFPCYQSLFEVAASIGCQVTRWPAAEADGWKLDLDFLAAHIQANTRAIIVNCPHNPTGYLMSHGEQQNLVEIARHYNLLLFSDEVYRGLEYNPQDRLPTACDLYENAVSLGVMSKTYGLAGLRIGWIATRNPTIYQAMASFKDYISICNSAPSEFLAALALRHKEKITRRNLDMVASNLALLDAFFTAHQDIFNWTAPKAGSIAFPSLKLSRNVESFCLDLIEKQGVLLLPGNYYDFGDRHFRIGFGRKNMPQALERLEIYLQEKYE
jgi:aspartate/methionine/tyrosine aminotransferase